MLATRRCDVPLERAGQRLVEVAQVERQLPLRRGPQSEVQDVRVAAQLHGQPVSGREARSAAITAAAPR